MMLLVSGDLGTGVRVAVEGILALVKLGRRSIDRGIKWAKMLEYCRETRKQAEVVPVITALVTVLAPHGCASPQGDKNKQTTETSSLSGVHGKRVPERKKAATKNV